MRVCVRKTLKSDRFDIQQIRLTRKFYVSLSPIPLSLHFHQNVTLFTRLAAMSLAFNHTKWANHHATASVWRHHHATQACASPHPHRTARTTKSSHKIPIHSNPNESIRSSTKRSTPLNRLTQLIQLIRARSPIQMRLAQRLSGTRSNITVRMVQQKRSPHVPTMRTRSIRQQRSRQQRSHQQRNHQHRHQHKLHRR